MDTDTCVNCGHTKVEHFIFGAADPCYCRGGNPDQDYCGCRDFVPAEQGGDHAG